MAAVIESRDALSSHDHAMHNGQFTECEVLENFQGHCGPRTMTCKLVLEYKDFPRGLQHWIGYTASTFALPTVFSRNRQIIINMSLQIYTANHILTLHKKLPGKVLRSTGVCVFTLIVSRYPASCIAVRYY